MKRFVGLALAGAVWIGGLSAMAADMPVKAKPLAPAPVVVSWTGIYGGLQVGATKFSTHIFNDSGNYSGDGVIGGLTLGANWQIPNSPIVLGIEGDGSWTNAKGTAGLPKCGPDCQTEEHWLATVRGRLGYSLNRELFYVTGGVAFVNFGSGQPGFYYNNSITQTGWAAGAGVESMIDAHWSWKLEYLYADFEQDTEIVNMTAPVPACPSPPGFSCSDYNRMHIVRGGLNYKF